MLKIPMNKMKEYDVKKSIHNKNVGTVKVIKFKFGMYYICRRGINEYFYKGYSISDYDYKAYIENAKTYDELEEMYNHTQWEEFLERN